MRNGKIDINGRRFPLKHMWSLVFVLLCSTLCFPLCAKAYAEDGSIYYVDGICYTKDGQISMNNGRICMFDYESGLNIPLCMKPDCKHVWNEEFQYDTFEDLLMNTDICYSQRAARSGGPFLMQGDQIYLFECNVDVFEEQHAFNVWKTSIDGTSEKLISLGDAFPWDLIPECQCAVIRNDDLFFVVHLSANPYGQASVDEQVADETSILYHASITTGICQEVMRLQDMYSNIVLLDVMNDVVYYQYELTSHYVPSVSAEEISGIDTEEFEEKSDIYFHELEENTSGGIKGIDYRTGETVILDADIAQLNAKTKRQQMLSMISDDKLFLFLNPAITGSEDKEHSTLKVIDLATGLVLRSCKVPLYDPYNGFCPYYILDEDHVLCYLFAPEGEYSMYNIRTEETTVLPLHNQFSAATGEQIYDTSFESFQTEYIFFSAGDGMRSFYLTRSMILEENFEPIPIESIH